MCRERVGGRGVGGNLRGRMVDISKYLECRGNRNRVIEGWKRERSILFGLYFGCWMSSRVSGEDLDGEE